MNKKTIVIIVLVVILVLAIPVGFIGYRFWWSSSGSECIGTTCLPLGLKFIEFDSQASIEEAADRLVEEGIVQERGLFLFYVKTFTDTEVISRGEYDVRVGDSYKTIIRSLSDPDGPEIYPLVE